LSLPPWCFSFHRGVHRSDHSASRFDPVFFVPTMALVFSAMAIVLSTMDFGIQKMLSSFETISAKPETTVEVPKTMVAAVDEPAAAA
jgi:hypothetical protein